jgi:hypothetical protein
MEKRIFCIWAGKNEMPPKRVECLRKLEKSTGCKIMYLNPYNIDSFILPEHPLHPAYEFLSETHKADYLRCYLMHFYGGGYTDIKLQSGSWVKAFDDLDQSSAYVNGYPVLKEHTKPLHIGQWEKLIGTNAIICKANTPFTRMWYSKIMEVLDENLERLIKNPAKHPQAAAWDGQGYPLEWTSTNADIFHDVCMLFLNDIIRTVPQPNLDLKTYRF